MRRSLIPTRSTRIGGHLVTPSDMVAQGDDGVWYVVRPVAGDAVAAALAEGLLTSPDASPIGTAPRTRLRLA
jgi:hypothetical protein